MPATTLLIAANLLPLAGVFLWGWDVFVLLMLYWLETLVIAFWAIVKMLLPPDEPMPEEPVVALRGTLDQGFGGRFMLAMFITVHAGIFMLVHFMFLWLLFAGPWRARITTPAQFLEEIVIGSDLWAPLLLFFIVRGWQVFGLRIMRGLGLVPADVHDAPEAGIPGGLYVRIFIMQITIIVGGWLALGLGGNVFALVLLVALKTGVELFLDRSARRPAAGPSASTRSQAGG